MVYDRLTAYPLLWINAAPPIKKDAKIAGLTHTDTISNAAANVRRSRNGAHIICPVRNIQPGPKLSQTGTRFPAGS